MPTKANKKIELEQRRQRVAELYVQGWTQQQIAEHLAVSQTSVCFDLKHLRQQWRESAIRNYDTLRDVELKKLERIEREAWSAWERSQKPMQSAVVNGEGGAARARKTVKNQHGDPRFLEQVHRCIAQRRALLGLDAQIEPAMRPGQVELTPEQHAIARAQFELLLNEPEYVNYLRQKALEEDMREEAARAGGQVIDLPRIDGYVRRYPGDEFAPTPDG